MEQQPQQELALAIVGLGKMGIMHAAMASACPGALVAALVDVDPKVGAHVRSIGLDAPFYASLQEAVGNEELDAAVVAAPSHVHRPLVEAAFDAGLDVLCEKPLAHTLADAQALAKAARGREGLCAAVGFMKGHQELFLSSARLLREGALGEIRRFHASVYLSQVFSPKSGWTFTKEQAGGGVLINTGIHLVHLVWLLFGRVTAVTCRAKSMHSSTGVEDTLTAILECESGAAGSIDMSWSVPGCDVEYTRVVAEGTNGVMELDDFRRRLHLLAPWGDLPKGLSATHQSATDQAPFTLTPDYCGEGYCNEMADFVRACRADEKPRYGFDDGYEMQRIVDALYRAADSKEWIELNPPAGLRRPNLRLKSE
ncbi:MAG: Gfo/Idh/MocA family oxidoreductase [Candidatus Sumerlaeota bacterium]|nr:Gfo/Idh/MocA family oxidoreductase [Candidatus Sumerlaeota bacterium]